MSFHTKNSEVFIKNFYDFYPDAHIMALVWSHLFAFPSYYTTSCSDVFLARTYIMQVAFSLVPRLDKILSLDTHSIPSYLCNNLFP